MCIRDRFSTGPLVLELVLIGAAIFWKLQDWRYVGIILATIAVYVWFTFAITGWRVKLRRKMNEQDTDANQKAIDSLLNFETVKYFGAAGREAARYDEAMAGYEAAALKTSYSLAFLNFGQAVLITAGLVAVMLLAAIGVQAGELTVGDFVLVNAYMIQITMPLNFLGTVYREDQAGACGHAANVRPAGRAAPGSGQPECIAAAYREGPSAV